MIDCNKKNYKVLFCDLDGTLINTKTGNTFPKGVWDMELRFDVLDAIKKLSPKYVFIVSNQGGIENGFVNEDSFIKKMDFIQVSISEYCNNKNVRYQYCTSNDKTDSRRKPNNGMLINSMNDICGDNDWFCGLDKMLMIGDASGKKGQFSNSDKKTAENFGIDYLDVDDFVKEYGQKENWVKRIFYFFKKIK